MNDDEIRQDDVEGLRRVLQCPQPRPLHELQARDPVPD